MKFTFKANELHSIVSKVSKATVPKSHVTVLSHLHFILQCDLLTVRGTDGETFFEHLCVVKGETDGEILAEAETLKKVLSAVKAQKEVRWQGVADVASTDVRYDKSHVLISIPGTKTQYEVSGLAADKNVAWKPVPEHDGINISFNMASFQKSLAQTFPFTAGKDELRYYLCGICLDWDGTVLRLCATDSRRISIITLTDDDYIMTGSMGPFKSILAEKTIELILKMADSDTVDLTLNQEEKLSGGSNERAWICNSESMVSSRTVEGQFPNWREINRQTTDFFTVKKDDFAKAVHTCAALISGKDEQLLRFDLIGLSLELSSSFNFRKGKTTAGLDCLAHDGSDISFGMQGHFMKELLEVLDSDDVTVGYTGPVLPIVVKEGRLEHLIMPMRLEEN